MKLKYAFHLSFMSSTLNEKQKLAYKKMTDRENIFLSGMGGSGKSYLIKTFYDNYINSRRISLCSSTGISAQLIGGTTLHSCLGIGLGELPVDKLVNKIMMKKPIYEKWKKLDTLIIDEISMISPELFDKIEECLRIIRNNDKPFGGVQMILSGDFLQLPCVKNELFVFDSESWKKHIKNMIFLDVIIRQKDIDFQTMLNEVRIGQVTEKSKKILLSRLKKFDNKYHDLIPTILFSTNKDVDNYNKKKMEELNSDETYEFELETKMSGRKLLSDDIAKHKRNIGLHDKLALCKGAQVMLTYNLDIESGLVNGSRGVVKDFDSSTNLPIVRFKDGLETVVDFHAYEVKENDKLILVFTQIPLKVAYALTIHKAQGATLDLCVISLGEIFEHGQAYVALSRVKDLSSLYLTSIDFDRIVANPKALEFYGL